MKYSKSILILAFLFHFISDSFCQTVAVKEIDSLNTHLLKDYRVARREFDAEKTQDSIKINKLTNQLKKLNGSDKSREISLKSQLSEITSRHWEKEKELQSKIDSLKILAEKYPILGLFGDTLFIVYSKIGNYSAKLRAVAITERIHQLKNDINFQGNTLSILESEITTDIIHGEKIIISISDDDAMWGNKPKQELAENYRSVVTKSILKYKEETKISTLLKEICLALLCVLITIAILFYVNKFFSWLAKKIVGEGGKKFTGLKIRNYTLLDSTKQIAAFTFINSIAKWLVILLVINLALPIVFGFFPWTQNFAQTLFGYILNPLKIILMGFWNYLPNLFTIVVIFFVFRYVIKVIHFLKKEIETNKLKIPGFYSDWANPTYQILRVILYAFMFVLVFPYLPGSDSPIFKGVSVFLGFLFTFGSAGSLSNIIAGIILTYMRLFKVGDRVKIGEVEGLIFEKSMLVTRIKTIKNEIISIPNSIVMSSHTINYTIEAENGKGVILHTTVTIGYDVPWRDMYKALVTAADRTNLLLKTPEPFVLQTSLDDFYVSYQINAYTKTPQMASVIYSELHQNIQDSCNEMGIEIMSPHYRAARDGNATTVPADYLSKDYKAPSFNVNVKKTD